MGPTLPASDELCANIKLAVIFPLELKPDTSPAQNPDSGLSDIAVGDGAYASLGLFNTHA